MTREEFAALLAECTAKIAGRPLDAELRQHLTRALPPNGEWFTRVRRACDAAIAAGWMCKYEDGGIRYGRVLKPDAALAGFSVDVVHMRDVVGPHHAHPNGEIDLVMPIDPGAQFDGHGAGWVVYGPKSNHSPTVRGGAALVLYLLPDGAIEFTKS